MEDAAAVEEHSRVHYSAIPRQIIGVGRYSNSTAHHNQEDEAAHLRTQRRVWPGR